MHPHRRLLSPENECLLRIKSPDQSLHARPSSLSPASSPSQGNIFFTIPLTVVLSPTGASNTPSTQLASWSDMETVSFSMFSSTKIAKPTTTVVETEERTITVLPTLDSDLPITTSQPATLTTSSIQAMPSGTSLTTSPISSPSSSYLPFAAATNSHELSTGAIVGITVGAIMFCVLAILTLIACIDKRHKERRSNHANLSVAE